MVEENEHYKVYEGHFLSPLVLHRPDLVPKESHNAYFQLILPTKWRHPFLKPVCVQLAGTGDHVCVLCFKIICRILANQLCIFSIFGEDAISWPNH